MTGFSGFELTSATGAKSWLIPIARSSVALMAAAVRAPSMSREAPNAIALGYSVAWSAMRVTRPPSWSTDTISGMRGFDSSAARWRPLDSSATCRGVSMLSVPAWLK